MPYYVCSLNIVCHVPRADRDKILADFERIWPGQPLEWTLMIIQKPDEQQLVTRLAEIFRDQLLEHTDYPPVADKDKLRPLFEENEWSVGSGGLHEVRDNVRYRLNGSDELWIINYDEDGEAYLLAHAEWRPATWNS